MKHQVNRKAGVILLVFAIVAAAVYFSLMAFIGQKMSQNNALIMLLPAIGGGIMLLVPAIFGIVMIVKGGKSAAAKKSGWKGKATVFNVMRVKNGYELVVSYRGESGSEYKHCLYVNHDTALMLRPNMVIECYIKGEDCYVDESNIKIIAEEIEE